VASMRETLAEIAYDPSDNARSKLLSTLSDFVFDHRSPSADEVGELCEVAKMLLSVADDAARCHFAETIAPSRHVPREMIFLLLQDSATVASSVLRRSPVLNDDDLLTFAADFDDDRLVFVAQRATVGAKLVEVLVAKGGDMVQLAVVENSGAQLSSKSIGVLIRLAETNESLCRSLVRRQEVPKADAEHLVQLIAKMLRMRMTAPVALPPAAPATEALRDDRPAAKAEIADILAAVRAGRLSFDLAITRLATDDRFNDLTSLLSGIAQIDDVSITRVMLRGDVNGIGMILKALDVSDETFDVIIALRKRRLKTSDAQIRYDRETYRRLSIGESKATLAQLSGARKAK